MRVFVGVELPDAVRRAAAEAAATLERRLRRRAPRLRLRWVDPENLHVTIWFIGQVNEEQFSALEDALRHPWHTAAFQLDLGRVGAFPVSGPPRVIWMGVDEGSTALAALHAELRGRLAPLGYEAERRPYAAHVTLARVKESRRSEVPAARRCLEEASAARASARIERVTLFQSHLSPAGSRYEPLFDVPLMR
ncbi:MAG TPA: RNA 2',3'-cyclic phosphodiesterase [Vicinamibacterales bacterium]|nr:RNA 2',3'-cyclic phosphodiesterase [Vicinamibacterales bacterium]